MLASIIQANNDDGFVPVVPVKHGEKITAPGVYDIPMGWYHGDCCVGPSVSSSGLRRIANYSPLHFFATSIFNPNREDEDSDAEESMALRVGRAAHTLLLEPDLFRSLYCTRPPSFDSWRTQASQKWRAAAQVDGFTVLEPKEMQQVQGVAASLRQHPLYELGILDGDVERAIIWQDEKTGIWLKSRPDVIPRGSNILADLKCTNDCRSDKVAKKIFEMGYDTQLGLAAVGMREVLRREVEEFALVMVEYKKPFGVRIASLPHDEIDRGLSVGRFALNRLATCLETNEWPSFDLDDNAFVYRSQFQQKIIDSDARFPKEF